MTGSSAADHRGQIGRSNTFCESIISKRVGSFRHRPDFILQLDARGWHGEGEGVLNPVELTLYNWSLRM